MQKGLRGREAQAAIATGKFFHEFPAAREKERARQSAEAGTVFFS
jgi:hypothetical protein